MKTLGALVVACLLSAAPVWAQSLVVHGTGLVYQDPATGLPLTGVPWPSVDPQCHWAPGDGSPAVDPPNTLIHDMAHTHLGLHAPIGAEINGPVTFTAALKLFHTAGRLSSDVSVQAFYNGPSGQGHLRVVLDSPAPIVGDPMGLVQGRTATITVDPSEAAAQAVGIPKHGWFNVFVLVRTLYDNGDVLNNESWVPFFSMVDPSQPEPPDHEDTPGLSARCNAAAVTDPPQVFGQSLVRFASGDLPQFLEHVLLTPIAAPQSLHTFSYNYGPDPNFPPASYHVICGNDYHMGVPGVDVSFKTAPAPGGSENVDVLDPVVLARIPVPMGLASNQQRCTLTWQQDTGDGFTDQYGHAVTPHEQLWSLFTFTVTIGDHPIGCTPATCPATGIAPPPPPPPPPPPDEWTTILPFIQRLGLQDRYRLCVSGDHCVELTIQ